MAKELAKGNDDRTDLNNSASTLKEETTKLDSMLDTARIHFKSKSYKDTILAILQDNPCPLKCQHLIRNVKKANIDSYYLARHEEVKKVIIDAILNEFGDLVKVTAEDRVSYGRLDIKIEFDGRRVVLKDNIKVVGIEIKSGDVVESKHFEQIDRYLFDVNIDLLIRIRVPTEDVVEIQNIYKDVLINDIVRLTNKTRRIMAKEASVVPGKWCKGCEAADCNYADENNFSSNNKGSINTCHRD
jgi:hypothetical protein